MRGNKNATPVLRVKAQPFYDELEGHLLAIWDERPDCLNYERLIFVTERGVRSVWERLPHK